MNAERSCRPKRSGPLPAARDGPERPSAPSPFGEPCIMGAVDLDEAVRDRDERARFEKAFDHASPPERSRPWVFPFDISKAGHIDGMQHLNAPIVAAGGTRFWIHALRNCFITVADR